MHSLKKMKRVLLLLFLLAMLLQTRHLVWSGEIPHDVHVYDYDTIVVRNTTRIVGGTLLLPCSISLAGDPSFRSFLVLEAALRFGVSRKVHCDVHLSNLTLVLPIAPANLLDRSALHYYRFRWDNVSIVGHALLDADGGELITTNMHLDNGNNVLDVRGMTIVHVHDSLISGSSALAVHNVDVLSLTRNDFCDGSLSITYVEEDHRVIPRIADLSDNVVRGECLLHLQCTQADIKTTHGAGGIPSFRVSERSEVTPSCHIEYAPEPSMYFDLASMIGARF